MPTNPTWEETTSAPSWDDTAPISTEQDSQQSIIDALNNGATIRDVPDKAAQIKRDFGTERLRQVIETPVTNYLPEDARNALDLPGQMAAVAAKHPEDTSFGVMAGMAGGVKNLANGFTSPIGLATLGIGAAPKATQKAIALAFAGQMATQLPDLGTELGQEFGKPADKRDTEKISRLLTEFAGTDLFASLALRHGLKDSIPAPEPKLEPAPDVSGRTLKMPEGAKPPGEIQTVEDNLADVSTIPSTGPTFAGIPETAIPKEAKPVVPETPPEAEKGISVVDEIRNNGAKTIADIQRLYPQAQLTREAARTLRNAAWGTPDNPLPAEQTRPKGEPNAIPERKPETLPVEIPPGSSTEVGGRISAPEKPAISQIPNPETQTGAAGIPEQVAPPVVTTDVTEPLNPGGSQAELSPDLQAQSKANNSRAAFEALAKEKGSPLPTPAPEGSPTAMKYRLIDQERAARGLEPLTKGESVSDQETLNKAMVAMDKNPNAADELVKELNAKPRTISDVENFILLLKKSGVT
jgi:hypothetical protein